MTDRNAPVYLPSLTGLRFYAALLVVMYHLGSNLGTVPVVSELARFGRTGVTFFFVLSGFVLAWSYWGRATSVRVFYWRRFARIWPLHVLATFVTGWVYWFTDHRLAPYLIWDNLWPALLLIHTWFPGPRVNWGWSGASWSLGNEAFFYAIFPVLVVVLARRRVTTLLAIIASMLLISLLLWLTVPVDGIGPYLRTLLLDYFPLSRVTQFVAGVALACAMRAGWRPPVSLPVAVGVVVAWHGLLYVWSEQVESTSRWYPYSASQLFAMLPFVVLIAAVASRDLAGRPSHLAYRPMVLLGNASFAWYLFHGPGILMVLWMLGGTAPEHLTVIVPVLIAVIIGTQLIAIAVYLWFEYPLEQRLRSMVRAGDGRTFAPGSGTVTIR